MLKKVHVCQEVKNFTTFLEFLIECTLMHLSGIMNINALVRHYEGTRLDQTTHLAIFTRLLK